MARRRRSTFATGPSHRSPLFSGGAGASYRKRRRGPSLPFGRILIVVVVLAGVGTLGYFVVERRAKDDGTGARRAAAAAFVRAWTARDGDAMWRTLSPASKAKHPRTAFVAGYERANDAATVTAVRAGTPIAERKGIVAVGVTVATKRFGELRGIVRIPVSGVAEQAGVDWTPALRLPGLRRGEAVKRIEGEQPTRGLILAADGTPLDATSLGASIAGSAGDRPTGLQRLYDERLAGHPSERLMFGKREIARVDRAPGRSVRTTIRPGLMRAAADALGDRLGGVAVVKPSDGSILALAGLAVSAPQPPGSTFKIVTAAAALKAGLATPQSTYAKRTYATLSGVKLRNASNESCGGTLTEAFIESCNSVFAPLGAKVGAKRLTAMARAFGFGDELNVPAIKASTISGAAELKDDIAVGSAAIGQERDLATPLQMASVAATIANDGRRAKPRLVRSDEVRRTRVVSERVAHQIRAMMLGVVHSGTGTAARLPGVEVAGKTGTAELKPNSRRKEDADAWFVAFAPAGDPDVAVAVMLVGAGFGGTAAAPIAKAVLGAALG